MLARFIILTCCATLFACSHHASNSAAPPVSLTSRLATNIAINKTQAAIWAITPQPTISHPAPQPYTYAPDTYPAKLASCHSDPNGSQFQVVETTRRFITIPRAIYPDGQIVKVSGDARAGSVSNGGMAGYALDGNADCWSTYYEFDGDGQVDFLARSAIPGAPDYTLHVVVTSLRR